MEKEPLLPELNDLGGGILYIIGNGFDLYHDLPSRYSDFRSWLLHKDKNHRYDEFVRVMEKIFPLETNQDMLWCNFENALGQHNARMTYVEYHAEANNIASTYEDKEMIREIKTTCDAIRPNMTNWAKQIPITNKKQWFKLDEKSWYITFNYTRVLEEVYKIPKGQICHVHGATNDSSYVVTGHNSEEDLTDRYDNPNDQYEQTMRQMIETFNEQGKKPENQMEKLSKFLSKRPSITDVVVIGHSLDKVDMPYFKKIVELIQANTQWHFTIHNESKDKFTIFNFLEDLRIQTQTIIQRGSDIKLPQKYDRDIYRIEST